MRDDLSEIVEGAVARAFNKLNIPSPWKDSEQAATYLSCSAGTLKTWRSRGEGPRYNIIQEKLIRYHIDDLDAFVRGEAGR